MTEVSKCSFGLRDFFSHPSLLAPISRDVSGTFYWLTISAGIADMSFRSPGSFLFFSIRPPDHFYWVVHHPNDWVPGSRKEEGATHRRHATFTDGIVTKFFRKFVVHQWPCQPFLVSLLDDIFCKLQKLHTFAVEFVFQYK